MLSKTIGVPLGDLSTYEKLSVPTSGDKDTFCYLLFAQTIPNCFTAAGITREEVWLITIYLFTSPIGGSYVWNNFEQQWLMHEGSSASLVAEKNCLQSDWDRLLTVTSGWLVCKK